jgi:hypothetical protein
LHDGSSDFHRNFHNCGKPSRFGAASGEGEGNHSTAQSRFQGAETVFLKVETDPEFCLEFSVRFEVQRAGKVIPTQHLDKLNMHRQAEKKELYPKPI